MVLQFSITKKYITLHVNFIHFVVNTALQVSNSPSESEPGACI